MLGLHNVLTTSVESARNCSLVVGSTGHTDHNVRYRRLVAATAECTFCRAVTDAKVPKPDNVWYYSIQLRSIERSGFVLVAQADTKGNGCSVFASVALVAPCRTECAMALERFTPCDRSRERATTCSYEIS